MLKFKAALGISIRQFRESLGMSQQEAADMTGLEFAVYSDVERGVHDIDIRIFEKIAMGLQMTYEDFEKPQSSQEKGLRL